MTTAKLWTPAFVLVVVLQFTLVIVNGSSTMAMPAIKEGLGASNSNIQWFAALFALGFALVLVMSGRLGDLFGTKRLLLIGFAALVLAMTFEALSPNIYLLLVARLLQGVAGGITAPQLSAMIQRTFDGHDRTRAFAIFLMVSAGGFMAGQLSAGALISSDVLGLGWRWAFLPIVPIGFVLWFFAARLLPHTPPGVAGRLDLTGAAVLGLVSFLVMFPLIQGRNSGWPLWIFVMLACSVPAFLAFVAFERRIMAAGGSPLIDPSLFAIPTFNAGNVITLLVGMLASAAPLYIILTIQIGFGRNALQAALLTCPMPFANMFGSLATAPLLRRFGRGAVAFGALFCALSAVAILIAVHGATDSIDPIVLVPGVMLLGFGLGISIASGIAIVLGDVPHENAGSASGVQSTGLQLAGAIGIALYGIAFYGAIGSTEDLTNYIAGMRWVMWISIALAAVQVALMFWLPRHRPGAEEEIPLGDPELLVFPDLHGD